MNLCQNFSYNQCNSKSSVVTIEKVSMSCWHFKLTLYIIIYNRLSILKVQDSLKPLTTLS